MIRFFIKGSLLFAMATLSLTACYKHAGTPGTQDTGSSGSGRDSSRDTDWDTETSLDADVDTDADTDTETDADVDTDSDADTGPSRLESPCDENASCDNTGDALRCKCNEGYAGDGHTCTDVDECASGTDNCDSTNGTCINTVGGYKCGCPAGWVLGSDGMTCLDAFVATEVSGRR